MSNKRHSPHDAPMAAMRMGWMAPASNGVAMRYAANVHISTFFSILFNFHPASTAICNQRRSQVETGARHLDRRDLLLSSDGIAP